MLIVRLNSSIYKVVTKKPDSELCMGKVGPYYDVVSISVVEFIDKHHNDNDTMLFSIKLFVENDNDIKLFKQLTRKVHRDWNWNLFAIYLCEVVMKD